MAAIYSNQPANPARLAYLRALSSDQDAAARLVGAYRDFYGGDQGAMLTTRLAEFLNVSTDVEFSVNLMALVVDSLAERLAVRGFATGSADLDELLALWWQQNRMDAQQSLVHTAAARDGQSFVIVEWDNDAGRPVYHVNEAWDGYAGVKVHWSGQPGSSILFVSKRWRQEFDESGELVARRRLNLYFADRVEKYVAAGDAIGETGWTPFGEPWPTPWKHPRTGQPLGVPVAVFLNKQTGVSELKPAISVQMALNKSVLDIMAAADVEGFGIYTKTGGAFVTTPYVAPGAFWQDTDPASAFGKIPAGSLAALLEAYWLFCKTIAIVTRRPLSLFIGYASGESGESLKEREAGLISQAKQATVQFGNAWEDVAMMALRLADAFGQASSNVDDLTVSTVWADVEVRNEVDVREMLREDYKAGLIDQTYFWQQAGVSEEDQQAMQRRQASRQATAIAQALRLQEQQQQTTPAQPEEPQEAENANGNE